MKVEHLRVVRTPEEEMAAEVLRKWRLRRMTRAAQALRIARVFGWALALWYHSWPAVLGLVSLYLLTVLHAKLFQVAVPPPAAALPRDAWFGIGRHRFRFHARDATPDELVDAQARLEQAGPPSKEDTTP